MTQTIFEDLNATKTDFGPLLTTIDFSKIFDTVPRHQLINKILHTFMHDNLKNGLLFISLVEKGKQYLLAIPLTPYTTCRQKDALADIYTTPQPQYIGTITTLFPV